MTTFSREFKFKSNIMEIMSKNIKKYRKLAGITQEQLAVDIDRNIDFTKKLENNKVGCSIETLYRISIVLNVSMDKFFK